MSSKITNETKQEIGQHFIVGFTGQEITPDVVSLIRDYRVGAFIIMKRNIKDIPQLRRLIARLQSIAKEADHEKPLLIGIDQENGLVSAFSTTSPDGGTQFPGAMALGATGDPALAELVNASTGNEMCLAGVNWAFSPVCDVNSDPRNPVIGVRSFGDDPYKVSELAAAVARGIASSGIAPSPKHFPGHGDTHVDSHIGLPRIEKTKAQLEAMELIPFKKLVEDGVATIMTGHMALPLVVGDDTPCSLSRAITTDLLRTALGYTGIVVTDCLEMDAVVDSYGTQNGAVKALQAGADVAMICHRVDRQKGAIEATYNAVQAGELSLEELKASGERIRGLKDRFAGSWDDVLQPHLDVARLRELKEASKSVSRDAYRRSTCLLMDEKNILPLKLNAQDYVLVLTPALEALNRAVDDAENIIRTADGKLRNTAGPSYTAFAASISQRVKSRSKHIVYGKHDAPPEDDVKNATVVIFSTRSADRSPWQLDYLRSLLKMICQTPLVVIATLTPYEVLTPVAGRGAAYLCSFEFTYEALDTAAAVVFGDFKPGGKLPVGRTGNV